jgi:hypothetical protein
VSRRLPDWVELATEPQDPEVSQMLDGDRSLGRLACDATEPLPEEVASLIRRGTTSSVPAPAGLSARWLLPGLALVLLVLLVLRPFALAQRASPGASQEVLATYTAEGRGSWTQQRHGAEGVIIEQRDGVVRYQVDPLPAGQRFRVRARSVEIEVVGTVFDVGVEGDSLWVSVLEGRVSVAWQGAAKEAVRTVLSPGERWQGEVRAEQPLARRAPRREIMRTALETIETLEIRELPPAPAPGALQDAVVLPEPQEVPERKPRRAGEQANNLASLLARVEAGERSEELVASLEAFAASAQGPLAQEALPTAIEVAAEVREPQVVIDTIDWFLQTHPRSVRRKVLLELRGDLARNKLRDCELALPSYRELASSSSGAQQARAEALRGLCAASVGRVDEARTALLLSLQLGLEPPLWSEVHAAMDALE